MASTSAIVVINSAKAWYRDLVKGIHWRNEKKRLDVIRSLPVSLRRLAFAVRDMIEEEKRMKKQGSLVDKPKSGVILRLVKG
jgi:hypothetical protein